MKTYHRIIQNNCDGPSFLEEPSHQINQQASNTFKGEKQFSEEQRLTVPLIEALGEV